MLSLICEPEDTPTPVKVLNFNPQKTDGSGTHTGVDAWVDLDL